MIDIHFKSLYGDCTVVNRNGYDDHNRTVVVEALCKCWYRVGPGLGLGQGRLVGRREQLWLTGVVDVADSEGMDVLVAYTPCCIVVADVMVVEWVQQTKEE